MAVHPTRQATALTQPQAGRPDPSSLRLRLKRPQLTGRSMLVIAMSLFLVVVLASPLQTYLNRRDAVAASEKQAIQLKQQVAQLQQQADRWNDPAYVEREARARLQYVRPGDTLYTVLNADGTSKATDQTTTADQVPKTGHEPGWNATLWSSVQNADQAK